jgi:hypothetical protein
MNQQQFTSRNSFNNNSEMKKRKYSSTTGVSRIFMILISRGVFVKSDI